MAENESLDLRKTPRWQRVHRLVLRGDPTESVVQEARVGLYRTVRAIIELIPFEPLFSAACTDSEALHDLTRRCRKGREYANLFHSVVEKGMSRENVLHAYFSTVCDTFLEQIAANSFPSERWTNLPDLRAHLAKVREQLTPDIDRIAHNLAEDPKWRPRMRPNRKTSSPTDDLLNESLLGASHK
jgi:hypothetical protein